MARLTNNGSTVQNCTNAYYATAYGLSGGVGNTNLASLAYQTGPLGRYYQPIGSALTNAGSCMASNAGLYHFTTMTNQVKEADSIVDIGLHYVAVDANGNPLDSDSDGLPDYLEDANGDGLLQAGETSFSLTDTDNDGISDYLEVLRGMNPRASGTQVDTSGLINLKVFSPLK